MDQKRSVEVTVAGIEQVTMPAGSFKAYKLVKAEQWQGRKGKSNSTTTTYFYSPDTRSIVKTTSASDEGTGTSDKELVKFTPGK